MKYSPIDNMLFIKNRMNFAEKMKPNSIAIFNSNDEMPRNGDQNFQFRQNSDMFYMSGMDQAKTILSLLMKQVNWPRSGTVINTLSLKLRKLPVLKT
jgi:hypothetical protein